MHLPILLLPILLGLLACGSAFPLSAPPPPFRSAPRAPAPSPLRRSLLLSPLLAPFLAPSSSPASSSPQSPTGGKTAGKPPPLLLLLRAREAMLQEQGLLSTQKFNDLQRGNVKLALRYIKDHYELQASMKALSEDLRQEALAESVLQNLNTMLEYFDDAKVDSLKLQLRDPYGDKGNPFAAGFKQEQSSGQAGKIALVEKGIRSTVERVDEFLATLEPAKVDEAFRVVEEENRMNKEEYEKFNTKEVINGFGVSRKPLI